MTEMPPYQDVKDDRESVEQSDSDASEVDDDDLPLCYDQPRHTELIKGADRVEHSWRVKEKYKTHCVALVLCLNVGVDPPDVVKTQPCARLECWIDPNSLSPPKALETIGQALQAQYERWQPRARYKLSLDPTSEEVKKLCCSLRRNAKDERVLFHYNGHGVPKPTPQGEIWVFNRAYTQYIPLSMYDLQTWMGAPSLYVYDCSAAGLILDSFSEFAKQHERDYETAAAGAAAGAAAAAAAGAGAATAAGGAAEAPPAVSYRNCIQLGACAADQTLPMHPELPADLFTACLTTPVKMAMRWFVLRHARPHLHDLIDKIPGQVTDRRTMLGELNWIFTAVTDTIAWSSLPPELFQQLFRADLLTASLCRNFLLADRIMRSYNCTPVSLPALPSLALHPLWAAWEHTLDLALAQLPQLVTGAAGAAAVEYRHSAFFRDQLTAFGVWLELGSALRPPPAQLPMVLQVLLSTLHRLRALHILCRFLALGPWAVRAVLNVGIFPYMLKLLQASAPDLRASMVYIWAKIIAVDPSCQVDLVNAKGHKYFLSVLQDPTVDSAHRTLAAYVLACIVDGYPAGQEAALQGSMISVCLEQAAGGEGAAWRLRLWALLGLGRLWRGYEAARGAAARDLAHEKLAALLQHSRPELRAAAAFALGTLAAGGSAAGALQHQVGAVLAARTHLDASPLVRAELLAALQYLVLAAEPHFVAVCLLERRAKVDPGHDALVEPPPQPHHPAAHKLQLPAIGFGSVYMKLWEAVRAMAREPHPHVSALAADIIAHVAARLDSTPAPAAGAPPAPRRVKLPPDAPPPSPIVRTQFVAWCCAEVARPERAARADPEARPHHERAWRTTRNRSLRKQAQELCSARGLRLESQAFHSRCSLPPQVVLFHPYDQHAAVAFKDNFGIWDWGTAAKLCVGGWRRQWGRITALAYLNATSHAPILCVAGHTGNVALYRAAGATAAAEPALVSAWRALPAVSAAPRPPAARPAPGLGQLVSEQFGGAAAGGAAAEGAPPPALPAGTLLRWCGARATLAAGGAAPLVRLWDARAERLLTDVATHCEHPAASMWRPPDGTWSGAGADAYTLCAGFADGSARAWDERTPARPVQALGAGAAHAAGVVCCARRPERALWLLAGTDGRVATYDTRTMRQLDAYRAPGPLAAADVHPLADLVACGSVEQCVSVYDLRGTPLNTVKSYEGFMGARIGPVSCLAFHPLRAALAVGSRDLAVSVYVSDPRR